MPSENEVYLTFDDGPHPEYTEWILKILDQHSVKASFFLIGKNVVKYPWLVKQIYEKKHTIGLHTFTHLEIDKMNKECFQDEIKQNQKAIKNIIGITPTILRPPKGKMSIISTLKIFLSGLKIIHFSITSNDWKVNSVDQLLRQINISQIRPGDIISFHDSSKHTCLAINKLIPEIKNYGLGFGKI